jgi:D-glycero-D-manno-heptose 1,7-bisphosphate phosphatase
MPALPARAPHDAECRTYASAQDGFRQDRSGSSKRCAFLDRDGVINRVAQPGHYILRWGDFAFIPQVVDWIRLLRLFGYRVIVVTNQRCVARGLLSLDDLHAIHYRMQAILDAAGAPLDAVYFCPHEDGECNCRKPRPGLVLKAAEDHDLNLGECLLIGDSRRDAELARTCGLRFIRVQEGRLLETISQSCP